MTTPSIMTESDNELLFVLGVCDGTGTSGTGFTLRSNFDGDVTEDMIAATAGSYVGMATESGDPGWTMSIAAFHGF
jgi:hypothetical protein